MKKLIIVLVAVCLVFAGVVGYFSFKNNTADVPQESAAPEAAEATIPPVQTLDYAALYASHEPDEVVLTIGADEMSWSDYFYWLHYYGQQVESYFNSMASYYGTESSWTDVLDGSDQTYAAYVTDGASEAGRQISALEGFAKENGVTLSEDDEAALAEQLSSDTVSLCGEGATEEEFFAKLQDTYLQRSLYERMNEINYLYQNGYTKLYGENGELVEDATAIKYLEDNDYISASHILLMTADASTGLALDEAAIAEKKATADKLVAELKAITDTDALVKRFAELKEEYCEDTGKTLYPDGYTFLPGEMVEDFETACSALEEYGVSDIIETSYGYHIILRLPLSADGVIQYSSAGTPMTARSMKANEEYGEKIQSYQDGLKVEYVEGFEVPNLLDYVK